MGLPQYSPQPGDSRDSFVAALGFLYEVIGGTKTSVLSIIGAASIIVAEKTGANDIIRDKLSSFLMTPPEKGGPCHSIDTYLREHYHPDGKNRFK